MIVPPMIRLFAKFSSKLNAHHPQDKPFLCIAYSPPIWYRAAVKQAAQRPPQPDQGEIP
jgi:hypothetical protein